MDFKKFFDVFGITDSLNGDVLYIVAGIAALFVILLIVWLLFKLSDFIRRKKGHSYFAEEISDEEQLFGD